MTSSPFNFTLPGASPAGTNTGMMMNTSSPAPAFQQFSNGGAFTSGNLPGPGGLSGGAGAAGAGVSISASPAFSFSSTGGMAQTPGVPIAGPSRLGATGPMGASSGGGGGGGHAQGDVSLDMALRGLDEMTGAVERLEMTLGRLAEQQARVFGSEIAQRQGEGEGLEGVGLDTQGDEGYVERLQGSYMEYSQLASLIQAHLSSTTLGALPLKLFTTSSVPQSINQPDSDPSTIATADGVGEGLGEGAETRIPMTMTQLGEWAEKRAALEFSRREGVRGGGKVVLDALRAR